MGVPSFCNIPRLASVHQVALLTGRVFRTASGAPSRPFLFSGFIFLRSSPMFLKAGSYFRYERTMSMSSLAATACAEVGLRAGSST